MRVTLKRHWGSDLDVVNNARVSFGKESEWFEYDNVEGFILTSKDIKLVNYLAKHNHWVPFANGIGVTLHLKVPIFVAAQIKKHQVGFDVSEISRRYVSDTPEFYVPEVWRKAADNVKQGSSDEEVHIKLSDWSLHKHQLDHYENMLGVGICPEQARMVLPQSMYTEMVMSGSLVGWARMYNQRSDSHAQKEIQEVATQVQDTIQPLYPHSWAALTGNWKEQTQ